MKNEDKNDLFDNKNIVHTYTRKEALEDGFLVEVPAATYREAGIKWPVYITRTCWEKYVTVPAKCEGQDEQGRLWDVLYMFAQAARKGDGACLNFKLYVRNDNRRPKLVELIATIGAKDFDDPQPAITIMLPGED